MKIQTTTSVRVTPHCLIYGPAKSGKTRLIPTTPNPLVCSTDAGLSSIRQFDIPFVECMNYSQVLEFVKWAIGSNEAKRYQTIVFDDLTEIAEQYLVVEKPKHKNLMQAFGALNDELMKLIRDLRVIQDRYIVFIAKQERIQTESGALVYSPKIPGKAIAPMLPYLVGEIYHMETWTDPATGQVHEVLRTKRTDYIEAGSRSGKLGEIEFAHLGNVLTKVMS